MTIPVDVERPADFPQEAKEIWDFPRLPVPPRKYFSKSIQPIIEKNPSFSIHRLNAVNCGHVEFLPHKNSVKLSMLGLPGGDLSQQGNIGIFNDALVLVRSGSILGNSKLPQLHAIHGMASFLAALPQVNKKIGMKPRNPMQSNLVWGISFPKGITLDTKKMRKSYRRYCTPSARDRVKTVMISIQQKTSSRGPSMNFTINGITVMGTRDATQVPLLARIALYLSTPFFIKTPKKVLKKRVSVNDTPAIGDMPW